MARTRAGSELTQLHRRRQLALRAATLRELLAVWPMFDIDDIDRSWRPLEAALLTLTLARRRESAGLASNYYRAFRTAEVGGAVTPRIAGPPSTRLLVATLRLLGPIGAKKAIAAGRRDVAATTLTQLSGVVSKQVMDGGRDTLTRTIRSDDAAKGWRRITSADPCDFCAGIAAEGVHGKGSDFPAHSHCSCTQEIAY